MTLQEVLDICNAFIEDSENKEKVEAYNNMLNSLTIRSYLPIQEKIIALVRTVIDSDKDIDVPESMFTAGIEISCLFSPVKVITTSLFLILCDALNTSIPTNDFLLSFQIMDYS